MAAKDKDTIYVDIDDEITGIIDKVRSSEGKVVALVLPKRASAFQSIVNMKLLKRAGDSSNKHLVLITTEAGLLPLAGAAGVHVAKTLNSKPEIPAAPSFDEEEDEAIEEAVDDAEPEIDASQPVGKLAGAKTASDGVETIALDDELPPEEMPATKKPQSKQKKNKKLAVPNFERFRLWLVLGILLIIVMIGVLIFATVAMPKATISIRTDASNVDTNLGLKLSTAAHDIDPDDGTIPAKLAQQQKTYTQQMTTTGQKNNGNKASGQVTVTNCSSDNSDITIPAGTGISANGQTYITQGSVNLPFSGHRPNGSCQSQNGVTSDNVQVLAQNGGSSFNVSGVSMTVAGFSNVNAKSGTISGGTDNIVQTVNQNDINNAKAKISSNDNDVKNSLQSDLKKQNLYAIEATFNAGTPNVTNSANVGDVANSVTVTETITYTMFGVKENDLNTLIEDSLKDQIDTSKQSILDNGLSRANFNVDNISTTGGQVTLTTTATAGPDLNVEDIKSLAAGKKAGAIKSELSNNPDVTNVDVKLSPFWVSSVPKKTSRIKVEIAKPTTTVKASNNAQ